MLFVCQKQVFALFNAKGEFFVTKVENTFYDTSSKQRQISILSSCKLKHFNKQMKGHEKNLIIGTVYFVTKILVQRLRTCLVFLLLFLDRN